MSQDQPRYYIDSASVDGHIFWMVRDRDDLFCREKVYDHKGRFTGFRDVHDTIANHLTEGAALLICARLNA